MENKKDIPIQELKVCSLASDLAQYHTPIGMSIITDSYADEMMYYGVIKQGGELTLGYACHTPEPQDGLPDLIAFILYKATKGICATDNPPAYGKMSSAQVAALAGYHSGETVLLDLDTGMVERYSCDEDSGYIPPNNSDWVFYNQECCACACAADIPALFKVDEWTIAEVEALEQE